MTDSTHPVHESLDVIDSTDIYRNDEWWKSVVRYQYGEADGSEVAVYLWHKDDGSWTRKNKYVVKTPEAWETDRQIVETLLSDSVIESATDEFPVSDYYTVGTGKTVFNSNGWWKAIVKVVQKGSYETEEIVIYLWQRRDDNWRRRQKLTIKSEEKWNEVEEAIDNLVYDDTAESTASRSHDESDEKRDGQTATNIEETLGDEDLDALSTELQAHLSASVQED